MNSIFPILVSMSIAAPVPKINNSELEKLQGIWVLIKSSRYEEWFDHDDGTTTVKIDEAPRITFFKAEKPKDTLKIVKLDSGKIDLLKESSSYKGDTVLGIYQIKGDELWLCYNVAGSPSQDDNPLPRPTEFKSPKETTPYVWVFKRAKKEEKKEEKQEKK